jgi:hypothetical protein
MLSTFSSTDGSAIICAAGGTSWLSGTTTSLSLDVCS